MTQEMRPEGAAASQVYHGRHVQFLVLSRRLAAKRTLDVPYVVVSINEADDRHPNAVIAPSPLKRAVLRLRFDDGDAAEGTSEGCRSFGDQHARQIVRFVLSHRHEAEGVIVHCHGGVSRSAAVAAALSPWLNGEEAGFFEQWFAPNPRVRRILSRTIASMAPEDGAEAGEAEPPL